MKKYIDAEGVMRACYDSFLKTGNKAYREIFALVEAVPAEDVQEVRRGEWAFKFYCGNMSGYDYGMNCSVCGKPTHRQFAEKMPPYCPNCGAKMEERE